MNREDAAREIDNTACCFSDKRFRDAMHMAAAALRGSQPDPITGLVPCGCGCRVEMHFSGYEPDDYYVVCEQCHVGTWDVTGEENAKRVWNTAMGYKEQ